MTLAVDIDRVSKRYNGVDALSELSLQVRAGQVIALIGHNGAGKTSLLKLILGVSRPSSGQISLWGKPQPASDTRIGFLPELVHFTEAMTGFETLRFFASIKRLPVEDCNQLLAQVGLSEAASNKIKTYSKGMRQRLGLAQALLGNPQLLILDEPTTGLDPDLRRDFYRIVSERQRQGATIIISTHSLHEIEWVANNIVILKKGHLLAQGSLAELCETADIHTRLQVSLQPGMGASLLQRLGENHNATLVADNLLELQCSNGDKLALLRRLLSEQAGIDDIHIHRPGLEDVYRHYMDREIE